MHWGSITIHHHASMPGEICVGPRRNDALSRPGFPFRVPDTSRAAKGASAVGKGGRSYLQFVLVLVIFGIVLYIFSEGFEMENLDAWYRKGWMKMKYSDDILE